MKDGNKMTFSTLFNTIYLVPVQMLLSCTAMGVKKKKNKDALHARAVNSFAALKKNVHMQLEI